MSLPQSFPMRVADGKTIQIPSVGFGTWADAEPKWCKEAVLAALNAGYRHLDCAWAYGVDQRTYPFLTIMSTARLPLLI